MTGRYCCSYIHVRTFRTGGEGGGYIDRCNVSSVISQSFILSFNHPLPLSGTLSFNFSMAFTATLRRLVGLLLEGEEKTKSPRHAASVNTIILLLVVLTTVSTIYNAGI